MGLREFSLKETLKRNFNLLAGISEELGLCLLLLALGLMVCYLASLGV
jgi:hypothetical protein